MLIPTDESGFCSKEPGASKTGALVTTDITVEVDLNLDAKLGPDTTPSKSFPLFVSPPAVLWLHHRR